MKRLRVLPAVALVALASACGAGHAAKRTDPSATSSTAMPATTVPAVSTKLPAPQALVTDETQNLLLVVDLPDGRVVRRVPLPADPEDVAGTGDGGIVLVVSSKAGKVTVLDRSTLRRVKTFGGFAQPHIVAISPDGQHAYVTDDARGTVTVIRLSVMRATSTIAVGRGAHHVAFSTDQQRAWIALGESASQIAILNTSDIDHPRLIGHFSPGFPAHDLAFDPNGRQVWIGSAAGSDVTAFDLRSGRMLFRVPVGAPPQHLAFDGPYAYLTSGYGGTIEKVDAESGHVIRRASTPYGSFELDAAIGYVATASLLRGTLAIFTPTLKLLRIVKLAPATREVSISRP